MLQLTADRQEACRAERDIKGPDLPILAGIASASLVWDEEDAVLFQFCNWSVVRMLSIAVLGCYSINVFKLVGFVEGQLVACVA